MNLRCKVCGEKAAGFHFGAFTCEGCKSFFGRCCNNMSIIGECRNNKECVIDKKNRTSCKACRLQKCLLVGMSKSGSRYGRRSNWFKQYFQEDEHHHHHHQQQQQQQQQQRRGDGTKHVIKMSTDERSERPSVATHAATALFSHSERVPTTPSSADLLQSPISSHLGYFSSYFPRLSINRLMSYRHEDKLVALPGAALPFASILQRDVRVNEYLEKLLQSGYESKDIAEALGDSDDPLDLSRKRGGGGGGGGGGGDLKCNSNTKKPIPLDLSVK